MTDEFSTVNQASSGTSAEEALRSVGIEPSRKLWNDDEFNVPQTFPGKKSRKNIIIASSQIVVEEEDARGGGWI